MINLESLSENPIVRKKMLLQQKRAQALQAWNSSHLQESPEETFTQLSDPRKERLRQKQLELNRNIATKNYLSEASVTALTALMTYLVESSVMYDFDEFKELCPTIHEDIKGTVRSFVENAGIQTDLKNKNTQKLIECVAKVTSTGEILESEEIEKLTAQYIVPASDVEAAINELQYDTMDKVSEIVQNDVDRIAAIDDDIAKVQEISMPPEEEAPVVTEAVSFENSATGIKIAKTRTVERKATKSAIIKEHYCEGLLEALAVKEGMALIESGKEYNSDIALGKALTYLTILEAFNATGLIEMGPSDYSRIAEMAGAGKKMFRTTRSVNAINESATEVEMPEQTDEPKTPADIVYDVPEVSRDGNLDNYEENGMWGTGISSQVDDISEDQLRAILIQKYGSLPEYRSLFELGTNCGFIRKPNGFWIKVG